MFHLHTAQIAGNPPHFIDASFNVFSDSNGFSSMNFSGTLTTDLAKMVSLIEVKGRIKEDKEVYDSLMFKATVDLCNIGRGITGNNVIRLLQERLEKYSNFRLVCPVNKTKFYATNFPMIEDKYFPSFVLGKNRKWELTATTNGKLKNAKSQVNLFVIRIYGEVVN